MREFRPEAFSCANPATSLAQPYSAAMAPASLGAGPYTGWIRLGRCGCSIAFPAAPTAVSRSDLSFKMRPGTCMAWLSPAETCLAQSSPEPAAEQCSNSLRMAYSLSYIGSTVGPTVQ